MADILSVPDLSDPSQTVTRVDVEAIARSYQRDDEELADPLDAFIQVLEADPLNYPHDDVRDLAWRVWKAVRELDNQTKRTDARAVRYDLNSAAERLASGINGARRHTRR